MPNVDCNGVLLMTTKEDIHPQVKHRFPLCHFGWPQFLEVPSRKKVFRHTLRSSIFGLAPRWHPAIKGEGSGKEERINWPIYACIHQWWELGRGGMTGEAE